MENLPIEEMEHFSEDEKGLFHVLTNVCSITCRFEELELLEDNVEKMLGKPFGMLILGKLDVVAATKDLRVRTRVATLLRKILSSLPWEEQMSMLEFTFGRYPSKSFHSLCSSLIPELPELIQDIKENKGNRQKLIFLALLVPEKVLGAALEEAFQSKKASETLLPILGSMRPLVGITSAENVRHTVIQADFLQRLVDTTKPFGASNGKAERFSHVATYLCAGQRSVVDPQKMVKSIISVLRKIIHQNPVPLMVLEAIYTAACSGIIAPFSGDISWENSFDSQDEVGVLESPEAGRFTLRVLQRLAVVYAENSEAWHKPSGDKYLALFKGTIISAVDYLCNKVPGGESHFGGDKELLRFYELFGEEVASWLEECNSLPVRVPFCFYCLLKPECKRGFSSKSPCPVYDHDATVCMIRTLFELTAKKETTEPLDNIVDMRVNRRIKLDEIVSDFLVPVRGSVWTAVYKLIEKLYDNLNLPLKHSLATGERAFGSSFGETDPFWGTELGRKVMRLQEGVRTMCNAVWIIMKKEGVGMDRNLENLLVHQISEILKTAAMRLSKQSHIPKAFSDEVFQEFLQHIDSLERKTQFSHSFGITSARACVESHRNRTQGI